MKNREHNVFYNLRMETVNEKKQKAYSIAELSKELGIKAPKISELELGVREASLTELIAYHNRFNVPVDYLLGYTKSRTYEKIGASTITGLSDISLNIIKEYPKNKREILNCIIEDQFIDVIIDAVKLYFPNVFDKVQSEITKQIGCKFNKFLAMEKMNDAFALIHQDMRIFDLLQDEHWEQYANNFLSILEPYLDKNSFEKLNENLHEFHLK